MVEHDKFSADLMELEHLLVRQFRTLQQLVETTQKERGFILDGDESVMRMVEDKEVLLDQLGLIEDKRRHVLQDLAVALKIETEAGSVGAILPYLGKDEANRIGRLAEGIVSLAGQARGLNHENQALALVRITWLKAAQSALIGVAQPEIDYRPAMKGPISREAAGPGSTSLEVRA